MGDSRSIIVALLLWCCALSYGESVKEQIKHVIVIVEENWSFDGLFARFPGADNLINAEQRGLNPQVDKEGVPYKTLPPDPNHHIPENMTNTPFNAEIYFPALNVTDLVHRFYQEQYQINGGRMDKFVAWSDAAGLAYSYIDVSGMYLGELARNYTLLDRFHHSAFGGSFLNHQWLIAAKTPLYPGQAPEGSYSKLDENGILVVDSVLTPDGYAVNTMYSTNPPLNKDATIDEILPSINGTTTIGDLLSEAGVSWAWFSGGYNDAMEGKPDPLFQFHHQPLTYYTQFAAGTEARALHLKDEEDFFAALKNGTLPSVSFVKPLGLYNMHPGESSIPNAMKKLQQYIESVQNSTYWTNTLIIIIWDENGGRWDHVSPPVGDKWGPGTRVPGLLVGPLAPKNHVDSTQFETLSVVKFIEEHFKLNSSIIVSSRNITSIGDILEPPRPEPPGPEPSHKVNTEAVIIVSVVLGVAVVIIVTVLVIRYHQRKKYEFIRL